jgi:hypothetical protein
MTLSPERFAPATLAELRQHIMRRGQTLSTLLAAVLGGKRPPELADLLAEKPGMRPEEVLRLALERVERRRILLDTADDAFGRCDVCGVDLGAAAVREMPWADRCSLHTAQ